MADQKCTPGYCYPFPARGENQIVWAMNVGEQMRFTYRDYLNIYNRTNQSVLLTCGPQGSQKVHTNTCGNIIFSENNINGEWVKVGVLSSGSRMPLSFGGRQTFDFICNETCFKP